MGGVDHGAFSGASAATDMGAADRYRSVRDGSVGLVEGLSDADCTVQSMPDASPAKWHLAHTTWFFEEFVLCGTLGQTIRFDPEFQFLFNSYYDAVGERHARDQRGLLSRPSLERILAYRADVDGRMGKALSDPARLSAIGDLLDLGLAHEEQHQELLLTDILHLFSRNPLKPAYASPAPDEAVVDPTPLSWTRFDNPGIIRIGHAGEGFAFDCEGPSHEVLLRPFAIADRCVTNAEWAVFIAHGGYEMSSYWLSDGWDAVRREGWHAPLYWERIDNVWHSMTLQGFRPVQMDAPVCHIGFYEADAFASWAAPQDGYANARLPLEAEWEHAARRAPTAGNLRSASPLRPLPQETNANSGPVGLFGDVWEWTASPFTPYPGFRPAKGAVGEYNGKFMSGQSVLRGGSCLTPDGHVRASYRNFFQPDKRWQFSGLRLARDI